MLLEELYDYYQKTWANVMRETKVGSTSIQNWKKQGFIPILSQLKIEKRTKGMFVAKLEHARPQD